MKSGIASQSDEVPIVQERSVELVFPIDLETVNHQTDEIADELGKDSSRLQSEFENVQKTAEVAQESSTKAENDSTKS